MLTGNVLGLFGFGALAVDEIGASVGRCAPPHWLLAIIFWTLAASFAARLVLGAR